ncbi:MAG: hypothetical protein ACFFB3_03100 [Candidatus Hodarchaeota archaeon]
MAESTKLGLSDKEFEIYLLMASLGPLNEGEIAGLMGISYEDAKSIVSNIKNRKLAFEQKGIIKKTGAILPTKELQETLETFAEDVKKIVDTVARQITDSQNQLTATAEEIDKTRESALLALEKSFELFVGQIKNTTDESTVKGNQARDVFAQDIRTKISQTAESVYQELTSNLTKTQQGLIEAVEKNKATVLASSDEKFNDIQGKLQSDQDHVQSSFSGAKDSVSLALGEEKSGVESSLKNLEETGLMMVSGWAGETEGTLSAYQEEMNNAVSNFSTSLANKLDESAVAIDNIAVTTEEGFKETLAAGKGAITSTLSQNRDSILEVLSRTKNASNEDLISQKTALELTQTESLAKMKETIETDLSTSKTGLEELRSQISTEFGQYDTKSQNLLQESRTTIEKSCETTLSSVAESTANLEANLKEKTTEYSEEHQTIVSGETEKTSTTFQTAIQEMIGNLQNLEQTLTDEVSSWRSKAEESSQNFAQISLSAFNQSTQELSAHVTDMVQGIQSNVTQTVSEIATAHSNTTISLKKQIDETFLKANQTIESLSSKILEGGEEALTTLTAAGTTLENLSGTLQATIDQAQEELSTSLESMQTHLFEELDKVAETSTEKMAEVRRGTAERIANLKGEQTAAINARISEIEATTAKTKEESSKSGTSLQEMLQQTIASSLSEIEQKTTQTSELITTRLDEQQNDFIAQRNQLNAELRSTVDALHGQVTGITEEAQAVLMQKIEQGKLASKEILDKGSEAAATGTSQLIEGLQTTQQGKTDQLLQATQSTSQETQNQISQNLAELGSTISASFGTASEIIETQIIRALMNIVDEKALGKAQEVAVLLRTLSTEIGKLKAGQEPTTQLIFTREAIMETIDNYLKTAKRRVTIFVPTPDDLPMDTLKGMPSTRQVQIICDPADNPDWHKALGDTGNIQIYHLSPTARLQPLFAVDREAEEIMLAPAEQEFPVGIISKEEPMIKALTQLLSHARGMATQQQR